MKTALTALAATALALGLSTLPAAAGSIVGVWQTAPDAKAQTGHVQITQCGAKLCGTVISAFDQQGRPITTPSVGRRILWDVGSHGQGRVYVPIMSNDFPVQLASTGNSLHLKACNAIGICKTQVWTRVK